MTARQIYDFAIAQIAWHEKDKEWNRTQVAWCNKELKRTRKEDDDLKAWALENHHGEKWVLDIYGDNYIGTETRKIINQRARHYRQIKNNDKWIAKYRKQAEEMEKYIG